MDTTLQHRYDVVIAGARVAGAATALLLARRGARVLVVDPLPRGRDTLSTHALMRAAVMQLHRWGLLDAIIAAGTPAVRTTLFDYGDDSDVAIPIQPRDGVDALYAPRRTLLDSLLADAAADAGATVLRGAAIVDLLHDARGRVTGARLAGPALPDGVDVATGLVVGADGLHSRVARLVKAPIEHAGRHAAACIYGYWPGLPRDTLRWCYRTGHAAGIIPTDDGDACVFVSLPALRTTAAAGDGMPGTFLAALDRIDPALAAHTASRPASRGLRGFAGVTGALRRAIGPGWALVGDAGFFRDPITAHGITDALRDADLLTRAIAGGDDRALATYPAARDAVARPILDISDRIASFAWSMDEVKALHLALSRAMNAAAAPILAPRPLADTAAPARRTA